MSTPRIIVGDTGGTNSRFAIAEKTRNGDVSLSHVQVFKNSAYDSLSHALNDFISGLNTTQGKAILAVAGPVNTDGTATLTNRDWAPFSDQSIIHQTQLDTVKLINDFSAMTRAIPVVSQTNLVKISGDHLNFADPILVTGPGTGFGMSTLLPQGDGKFQVLNGEGGHASFAPQSELEQFIHTNFLEEYGYVSNEMLVSGAWLQQVYRCICRFHNVLPECLTPVEMLERANAGDKICEGLCRLRARAILRAVGDGVLITGARGGVVLTGGVSERMVKWLSEEEALEHFFSRSISSNYLNDVPIFVLKHPIAALIGAATLFFEA